MTVYIATLVTEHEYCGRENMGVFSTREAAERYIESQGGQRQFEHWSGNICDEWDIEEWELD